MAATTRVAGARGGTCASGVLGISQSWRTRYRNAEQQGPDDPNNMPRSVHRAISMPGVIPAH